MSADDADADEGDDTASADSGFDKEAEREKLREKFERDERKRESTKRMSELLLTGATMTNDHCDDCGAPIFRQNGTSFCPNCDMDDDTEAAGTAAEAGADADHRTPDAAAGHPAPDEDATAGDRRVSQHGAQPQAGASGEDTASGEGADPGTAPATDAAPGNGVGAGARVANDPTAGGRDARSRNPHQSNAVSGAAPNATGDAGGDDLAAGRAALARALRRHAEAAATTDDARTASDHLAAAREAAEALAALRR